MDDRTGQTTRPVPGDGGGRGLLQGLVGEQPVGYLSQTGELAQRPATQSRGLDKGGGALPEPLPNRGHIGEQAGIREAVAGHLGQRRRTHPAGQVVDIGAGEAQDGLTPVIMTL